MQFLGESIALALIGSAAGVVLFGLAGPATASLIVAEPVSGISFRPVFAVAVLLYAVGLCVVFGATGSLYPVRQAIRSRPSEAVRHQ